MKQSGERRERGDEGTYVVNRKARRKASTSVTRATGGRRERGRGVDEEGEERKRSCSTGKGVRLAGRSFEREEREGEVLLFGRRWLTWCWLLVVDGGWCTM